MSLSTKQQRGSAINVSSPWRVWLAEPSGDVDYTERVSLLRFCSAVVDVSVPPEVPGIEYRWTGYRIHYVWTGDRLHYRADEELSCQ